MRGFLNKALASIRSQTMIATVVGRLCQVLSAIIAVVAVLCGWMFFVLYWPYRHLFNEEGRYFCEANDVVYDSQSGVVIVPAILLGALAVLFALIGRRLLQKRNAEQTNAAACSSAADESSD